MNFQDPFAVIKKTNKRLSGSKNPKDDTNEVPETFYSKAHENEDDTDSGKVAGLVNKLNFPSNDGKDKDLEDKKAALLRGTMDIESSTYPSTDNNNDDYDNNSTRQPKSVKFQNHSNDDSDNALPYISNSDNSDNDVSASVLSSG